MIGIVLASAWVLGYATWQLAQERERTGEHHLEAEVSRPTEQPEQRGGNVLHSSDHPSQDRDWAAARRQMVEQQLATRDISDNRVLEAMLKVPRHLFVPENSRPRAHFDGPLPIGHGQTISQPYIVALMTQLAQPTRSSIALDVGTGSGYQAAVLSVLCQKVYSIEIVEPLAESARRRLAELGYQNVTVRHGDGYRGWLEQAPFDLIIVAAAPEKVPQPLIEQLRPGGRW